MADFGKPFQQGVLGQLENVKWAAGIFVTFQIYWGDDGGDISISFKTNLLSGSSSMLVEGEIKIGDDKAATINLDPRPGDGDELDKDMRSHLDVWSFPTEISVHSNDDLVFQKQELKCVSLTFDVSRLASRQKVDRAEWTFTVDSELKVVPPPPPESYIRYTVWADEKIWPDSDFYYVVGPFREMNTRDKNEAINYADAIAAGNVRYDNPPRLLGNAFVTEQVITTQGYTAYSSFDVMIFANSVRSPTSWELDFSYDSFFSLRDVYGIKLRSDKDKNNLHDLPEPAHFDAYMTGSRQVNTHATAVVSMDLKTGEFTMVQDPPYTPQAPQ